ncbi:uncharacterized protein BO72DRAFT_254280 [Aspergillus fijiensis CBS 313.89]|uniref:Uncharacterized protein n=1 Tax=Aspergillus fijiensis CBS 313.89 TaxID=1448319 RepID=A0A8G1RHV1_9EURO|nr:uncharacterized protein BO72DRAFT_254280 [Aspergillus fijiensis CBS 313.89]RAK72973.1 hypothetical protein BO72DRAFT_254280 [Aspergillus fijiensis CBS 313.89]
MFLLFLGFTVSLTWLFRSLSPLKPPPPSCLNLDVTHSRVACLGHGTAKVIPSDASPLPTNRVFMAQDLIRRAIKRNRTRYVINNRYVDYLNNRDIQDNTKKYINNHSQVIVARQAEMIRSKIEIQK